MKVSRALLAVCLVLIAEAAAKPSMNKHWSPSDFRCLSDSSATRFGGSPTTSGGTGQSYWTFNGNRGSCEEHFGKPEFAVAAFNTQNECDKLCLNIYHFS